MIIILKGDKGNVDLKHQIELDEKDKEKLIEFLRDLFYTVEEEENFRSERIGEKTFSKSWTKDEYRLLLTLDKTNMEVSKLLGRSWMSIEMKRMSYIPEMMRYANKKGINILKATKKVLAQLVEDYVKEHEEKMTKRKEVRKKESLRKKLEEKEYIRLKEEVPRLKEMGNLMGLSEEDIKKNEKRLIELEREFEGEDL